MTLELIERVQAGDQRACGRLISLIENESAQAEQLLEAIFPLTRPALVVGVTGSPGVGKSSLVDQIALKLLAGGGKVGILAVDPSSPFTGGAILGDRVRMQRHAGNPNVFIRSMSTRGSLGGLAKATAGAIRALELWGAETILVETVGVGQSEIEIVRHADTVLLVLMPGAGDGIQAMKAGIMEIGDLFVVNKADHPEIERTLAELKGMLSLAMPRTEWMPEIFSTVATGVPQGIDELMAGMAAHRTWLESSGELAARRRNRLKHELLELVESRLRRQVRERVADSELDSFSARLLERSVNIYPLAAQLARQAVEGERGGWGEGGIDHIGIAVPSIEAVLPQWTLLGLKLMGIDEVPEQGVRLAKLALGNTVIELLEPAREDSPIGKFLARNGPGLHHLALRVTDITKSLNEMAATGAELIDKVPRQGAHGSRIAFLHPRSTGGVMIELVQTASEEA